MLDVMLWDLATNNSVIENTTVNISALPIELFEAIIDELADDHPSLNACSLTCRSWVHRSRYRIHRNLRFSELVHVKSDTSRYNDPNVAQYVHSLEIVSLPPTSALPSDWSDIWCILSRLTHVQCLTIQELEDVAPLTPFLTMVFPNVTSLTLGAAEFDSFAQFKSFFASFNHITRFQLREFEIGPWFTESEADGNDDISDDEDDYLEFPPLQHLTLSGGSLYSEDLIDFASWLRSELRDCSSLRRLTFETWYGGRFGTMKAYLSACRRSLEILELPMGALEGSISRFNFKRLGIKRLSRLHTITFIALDHPWAMRSYKSDCVSLSLAQITSDCISRIVLDFTKMRGASLDQALDFGTVDDILSKRQFTKLRAVDVLCNRDQASSRREAEDIVRQGLPRAVSRKIVFLDFGDFKHLLLPSSTCIGGRVRPTIETQPVLPKLLEF